MGLRCKGAGLPHRGGASMDHPVGFTDGGLSTRWPSAFSVYEFQVNGS
jgi:hypothetical protein